MQGIWGLLQQANTTAVDVCLFSSYYTSYIFEAHPFFEQVWVGPGIGEFEHLPPPVFATAHRGGPPRHCCASYPATLCDKDARKMTPLRERGRAAGWYDTQPLAV